jgi:hypothetical protein
MGKWKRTPDGRTVKRNSQRINGQFAPRCIDMLEAPAYRVLTGAEHRLLARLEIELAHHGGLENGNLIVTYDQLEDYGVRRESIGPARRACEALGFIKTKPGRGGNSEFYQPNKFLLTYRPVQVRRHGDVTHPAEHWRCIKTIEEARRIAEAARAEKTETRKRKGRAKKQKPSPRNGTGNSAETALETGVSQVPNRGLHPQYRNGDYYLESRGGGGDDGGSIPSPSVLPSEAAASEARPPRVAEASEQAASSPSLPSELGRDEIYLTAGSSVVVPFRRAAP